nr:MAG TPA: hypothetical protein [Microviridae sp.]
MYVRAWYALYLTPSLTGQAFCTKQNDCRIVSERKGCGKPGFSAS